MELARRREKLQEFREKLKDIEVFSEPYGVKNILDSFGHRTLQVSLATGFELLPKNSGNDLIDSSGTEYELKTVNINASSAYFAGVRISKNTIERFRKSVWLFAEFNESYLEKIYLVEPILLEWFFKQWEIKLLDKPIIIDQKISIKVIRKIGTLIYQH